MGKVDNNKHIVNSSDGKSGRSGLNVMLRLIGLVKPLAGYMAVAILMGLAGHLCASFITIFGGYAILDVSGYDTGLTLGVIFVCVIVFALVRAGFRYAEQSCNHFIAFKLLAIIRDKVFRALRKLCPARLEGRDRGNLISIITSDIELLEVFYAHTISPIAIAVLYTIIMCCYIGSFHWSLALIALIAYILSLDSQQTTQHKHKLVYSNRLLGSSRRGDLRDGHLQHTILVGGADLLAVSVLRNRHLAVEATEVPLHEVVLSLLVLLLLLLLALALDDQRVVLSRHLNLVLLHSGHIHRQIIALVGLVHIHASESAERSQHSLGVHLRQGSVVISLRLLAVDLGLVVLKHSHGSSAEHTKRIGHFHQVIKTIKERVTKNKAHNQKRSNK